MTAKEAAAAAVAAACIALGAWVEGLDWGAAMLEVFGI